MASLLGKYQPIARLGHGGMADVYLAVAHGPVGFNKLQVIKRLRSNLAEETEFLTMFLDEARLAARLNHPNVVQTNEVGESNGRYYIAMEYLEGQPLNRILKASPQPSHASYLTILSQALAGLHHAHELVDFDGKKLCVVHRDVSPHNIFVTYEGAVKLVDFGVAKAATHSAQTRAGVLKGKVGYMPPEQARGADVDRRADIFSVGVILWEILAGRRLWEGLGDAEIQQKLVAGEIPSPKAARPDLPPELAAICERATSPGAADRYPTAAAMRDDIEAYLARSDRRIAEKEIIEVMSAAFGTERAELKAVIEKRVSGAASAEIPSVQGADDNDEITGSVPALQSHPSGASRTPSRSRTAGKAVVSSVRPASPRGRMAIAIAVGVVALGAGAVAMRLRSRDSSTAVGTIATAAASGTVGADPVAPKGVAIQFDATPPEAKIYLDDALLPGNPYSATFAPDSTAHRVRAEAPGFKTSTRIMTFATDEHVQLALDKDGDAAPTPKKVAAPAAPKPPPAGKHPSLDKDPWAK